MKRRPMNWSIVPPVRRRLWLLFALLVASPRAGPVFEVASLREKRAEQRTPLTSGSGSTARRRSRPPNGNVLTHSVRGTEGGYQRIYPIG